MSDERERRPDGKERQKRHMVPIHDVHYERFDLITARMSGVSRICLLDADKPSLGDCQDRSRVPIINNEAWVSYFGMHRASTLYGRVT